jgi:hypothetical protein
MPDPRSAVQDSGHTTGLFVSMAKCENCGEEFSGTPWKYSRTGGRAHVDCGAKAPPKPKLGVGDPQLPRRESTSIGPHRGAARGGKSRGGSWRSAPKSTRRVRSGNQSAALGDAAAARLEAGRRRVEAARRAAQSKLGHSDQARSVPLSPEAAARLEAGRKRVAEAKARYLGGRP